MDYHVLHDELAQDPAGLGYVYADDAVAAVLLNAATRTQYVPVATETLLGWAYDTGVYPRLRAALHNTELPIELTAAIESLLDLRYGTVPSVDVFDAAGNLAPATDAMFDALQAAELMTADERSQVEALAVKTISRATELGLGIVTPGDVILARGGVW